MRTDEDHCLDWRTVFSWGILPWRLSSLVSCISTTHLQLYLTGLHPGRIYLHKTTLDKMAFAYKFWDLTQYVMFPTLNPKVVCVCDRIAGLLYLNILSGYSDCLGLVSEGYWIYIWTQKKAEHKSGDNMLLSMESRDLPQVLTLLFLCLSLPNTITTLLCTICKPRNNDLHKDEHWFLGRRFLQCTELMGCIAL